MKNFTILLFTLFNLLLSQYMPHEFTRFSNEEIDSYRENRKEFLDQLRKNITEIRKEMMNRRKDGDIQNNKPLLENCIFSSSDDCKEKCNGEGSRCLPCLNFEKRSTGFKCLNISG